MFIFTSCIIGVCVCFKERKSKPPPGKPGFRFFPGSLLESNREAEHLSGTRPPHVPLPPEAVAATLRPLLDPEVPSAKKGVVSA